MDGKVYLCIDCGAPIVKAEQIDNAWVHLSEITRGEIPKHEAKPMPSPVLDLFNVDKKDNE